MEGVRVSILTRYMKNLPGVPLVALRVNVKIPDEWRFRPKVPQTDAGKRPEMRFTYLDADGNEHVLKVVNTLDPNTAILIDDQVIAATIDWSIQNPENKPD